MFKKAAVELLFLKKDDFERVLKASMQKQWDDISSALKQFPYFEDWDEVATRECCMLSDTMSYNIHDIILGKGLGKATSAHFVLSGTISMVQRLMVIRNPSGGFKLDTANPPSANAEPVFMQVCLFNQGGSFNLGESLTERTVVADSDVKVLRILLYLLRQYNTANIWHRIRQFMSRFPCITCMLCLGESLTGRTVVADSDVKVLQVILYLLRQYSTTNIWHRIQQFMSRFPCITCMLCLGESLMGRTVVADSDVKVLHVLLYLLRQYSTTNIWNSIRQFMSKFPCITCMLCLGESLTGRTVVADSDVKVLRIPLYLLRQHNTANIWHRIRQFMESRLPTEQQLFSRFQEARRWDRHRKALCTTLRNPETLNDTTLHDTPYYWRVLDMEMCGNKPCDQTFK